MAAFLLSMPVLMAHFEPMHTWDDFWVYIFVPLSFGLALSGRNVLAALAMVVALLSKESVILFLPFLFIASYQSATKSKSASGFISAGIGIVTYVLIRLVLYGTETAAPYDCLIFNFESPLRSSDTIFSFLVSLGFLWVIGIWQVFRKGGNDYYNLVRWGAVITVIGFIASTILYGHARESRLFVPPALFLIPLALWYVQGSWRDWVGYLKSNLRMKIVLGIILFLFSVFAVSYIFPAFEYRTWPRVNRLYLAGHLWVVVMFVIFELERSGKNKYEGIGAD
jgi:hypothetical protein